MPTEHYKPLIVISYAHADEPEKPTEGEVKWLSFVTSYLRPAVRLGAIELWADQLMPGGADWEREIDQKLRACDIFILLVSRHSLSSDYVVDKEIALIRERQANGEDVHFYPLVLTPTPKIALDLVRDKNLRPRDGRPFSEFSLNEQYRYMNDASDEIVEIASKIKARRSATTELPSSAPFPTRRSTPGQAADLVQILLSYREIDDEPPPENPGGRYVRQLSNEVTWELRQLGVPDRVLWMHRSFLWPHDATSDLFRKALNEADLFIILLSRNYVESAWCNRELSFIAERLEDFDKELREGRIFRIDKDWVPDDKIPGILRGVQAIRLYDIDPGTYLEKEYFRRGRFEEEKKYNQAVHELAVAIYLRLQKLQVKVEAQPSDSSRTPLLP